jgi:hypothetical protein
MAWLGRVFVGAEHTKLCPLQATQAHSNLSNSEESISLRGKLVCMNWLNLQVTLTFALILACLIFLYWLDSKR